MQSTKSVAKKQQLREELLRVEQQIQSEKALRKKRELEKAAKVSKQPFLLLFLCCTGLLNFYQCLFWERLLTGLNLYVWKITLLQRVACLVR